MISAATLPILMLRREPKASLEARKPAQPAPSGASFEARSLRSLAPQDEAKAERAGRFVARKEEQPPHG